MNKIFYLFVLFIVTLSCKKTAADPATPTVVVGKIKSIVDGSMDSTNVTKTEIEYLANGQVAKIKIAVPKMGLNTEETFSYDDKNVLQSSVLNSSQYNYKEVIKKSYSYDTLSRSLITKMESSTDTKGGATFLILAHDAKGIPISFTKRYVIATTSTLTSIFYKYGELKNNGTNITNLRLTTDKTSEFDDIDYLYDTETYSPFYELYTQTLKVSTDNIMALSPNNIKFFNMFFAGKKYQIEGKYNMNRKPLIHRFSVFKDNEWRKTGEIIYEYYQ